MDVKKLPLINKNKLLFLIPVFILITFVLVMNTKNTPYQKKLSSENAQAEISQVRQAGGNEDSPGSTGISTKSSPVTKLPWENDERFKKAQQDGNTPKLMAAYRTVLRDPLPGEEENVHLAARLLAGKIVKPEAVFSQNSSIGPYSKARGFKEGPTYIGTYLSTTTGGGVCKLASTLYNVAVLSNLEIVERHAHGMPVPYVPYGQDATVSYGNKDFKFKNTTSHPILIWAEGIDNILYIGFYSQQEAPQVEWHHDIIQKYKAGKIYRWNKNIPKGEERLVIEGMDGAQIKSWVVINKRDGTTKTKQLGYSFYSPMPYLIEKS